MRTGTVSYKLEDLKKGVIIPIGFVGENDFTKVFFDAEEIYKKYPSASVSMKVQPPKGVIYPATVTRDGNTVIWQVKEADVANRGGGEFQLTFTDGETKIKTYIARTDVKRSLAGNGPAPDPVQDWVDNAEEVLDDLAAMDNIAKTAQASDIGKALSPKTVEKGVVTEWQYVEPGGGTEDYDDLDNKPAIGGVTLSGDKSLTDLGIASADSVSELSGDVADVKTAIHGVYQSSAKVINAKKSRRPLMTFIDDDSCIEFASIWPAICEEKEIKVNCAVISDSVGDSSHLSWSQIEQMHNDGIVEFVNHTDAQENLAGIDPEEAYTRVKKCKDALASHGIKTGDILVYPYGTYDESAIDAFKGICRCGITTDKGTEVTWNEPPVRTFALWRNELVETSASANPSLDWMKSVVDKAIEKNAWVIWMSHSQYAGFDASAIANIKSLIDYAREKNVDIVTAGEALELYSNAFEIGRYKNNGRASGLVIGCDGTTYGRGANFEEITNTYLFHKPIESYPINSIIANIISGDGAVGFPMDGTLITVTAPTTAYEYKKNSYQLFKASSSTILRVFERGFSADGLPNDFLLKTPIAGASSNRPVEVGVGYVYYDTTLGKPIFVSVGTQRAWYKLEITNGTTSAGQTKFAGTAVTLEAGMTKEEVRDAVANALCPMRTNIPTPGLLYYTPKELGMTDDGVTLYCMRSAFVNYTVTLWVDPVAPDTGCRGDYTRLRDGVAPVWVDATGTVV